MLAHLRFASEQPAYAQNFSSMVVAEVADSLRQPFAIIQDRERQVAPAAEDPPNAISTAPASATWMITGVVVVNVGADRS
jgi:hypothetical protein